MGASSSSRFFTAQTKESPSTVADVVSGLDAMTMVGAEGASTSGRTEYYSARCEAMVRSRGQFSDDVALEIKFSEPHQSEVVRLEVAPQSAEEEALNRENRKVFWQMWDDHGDLFGHTLSGYVLGRMIAKGGQAGIYEVVGQPDYLMKVFERGTSLRHLRRSCPRPILNDTRSIQHCIVYAGILKDGRFAFLMQRCWGDLRKLIDQAMLEKNVHGMQGPPFPYKWKDFKRWTFYPEDFMLSIARHIQDLFGKDISHRDLKASNVLIESDLGALSIEWQRRALIDHRKFGYLQGIFVADFECSIGVLGTGFWRAPEILAALGNASTITNEQWKKADVYSYGMICFEIVTGRIPFDGELKNTKAERQLVIEGKRPQLPSDLDDAVKDLITKCWEPNPSLRPTFSEIVETVETISTRRCQIRLFDISDELPPHYHLATVEEVNDYPLALSKAFTIQEIANLENGYASELFKRTPKCKIANLANGSIQRSLCEFKISLVKRNDASYKLARLHQ